MKSISDLAPAFGAPLGVALALGFLGLAGCSTIQSVSPFASSVPYAQDVQPTVARPASPEVPVYKKQAAAPEPAPVAAAAPPPPAEPKTEAPAAQPAPQASAQTPPPTAPTSTPQTSAPQTTAPPASAPQTNSSTGANDGAQPAPARHGKASDAPLPSIPAEEMAFQDDGQYRNLAQVPARPKNLPSFAEARATERALASDRSGGGAPADDKAAAGVDATAKAGATRTAALTPRPEDRAPCGNGSIATQPAATLRFDPGSAAMTSDQNGVLAEAIPEVRTGSGTIRIVGHGDSETGSRQGMARFDLAMARAEAVAVALAGFGIPAQRIAVTVACDDNPAAGASVQLYATS